MTEDEMIEIKEFIYDTIIENMDKFIIDEKECIQTTNAEIKEQYGLMKGYLKRMDDIEKLLKFWKTRMIQMKPIAFSGMMCYPENVEKDGKFRIKGTISFSKFDSSKNHPDIVRYENFASTQERDKRYNLIVNLLKEGK